MFATLGILPQLRVSEKIGGRKHKGGRKQSSSRQHRNPAGFDKLLVLRMGMGLGAHSLLLRNWMELVGMKYSVGFSTG